MNVAKKWGMAMLALGISIFMALPAFAGEWIYDGPENWNWWYKEADGTYPKNAWKQIDGEWYHFDNKGYLDIGWHNYPIIEILGEGEYTWEEKTDCWYYMDDSGKMLKNQNYIGGYSDDSGLLHLDDLDKEVSKYHRYAETRETGVEPPVADAQFVDGSPKTIVDSEGYGVTSGGGRSSGWDYDIADYKKTFFTEVKQHIINRDKSFIVPLSTENRKKDLAILLSGVHDTLDNMAIVAEWEYTMKDDTAYFNFTEYYSENG